MGPALLDLRPWQVGFSPAPLRTGLLFYYLALQTVVEAKNGTLAKRLTLAPTTAAIGPAREAAIYGQFILMNPDLLGRQV